MHFLIVLATIPVALARESSFIVGGSDTTIEANPWQGSLRTSTGLHSCGCVAVAENWILAAAHCVGNAIAGYSFRFGSTDSTQGGQVRTATNITRHPDYGPTCGGGTCLANDIAVIELNTPLDFGTTVSSISIAENDDGCTPSDSCRITGWGRTCGSCILPDILQTADITVLTDEQCTEEWPDNYNSDHHICAQDLPNQVVGSCNGDSGGPLVCGDVLCGTASWMATGCFTDQPSVFTRMSTYRDWVCDLTGSQANGC